MFFFLIWKVRCDIFFMIKVYCLFWFKCKGFFGNIYVIVLILVNEVWICCGWGSKEIELYYINGELLVLVILDIFVDYIVLIKNGNVLIFSYNGNLIWCFDE